MISETDSVLTKGPERGHKLSLEGTRLREAILNEDSEVRDVVGNFVKEDCKCGGETETLHIAALNLLSNMSEKNDQVNM